MGIYPSHRRANSNIKKTHFYIPITHKSTTVDQLMFAAINVRALANQSISPAINVRDLGSQ